MSPGPRSVTCERCGYLALRVATVLEAAAVVVEHAIRSGCDPTDSLIHPLEVGRGR